MVEFLGKMRIVGIIPARYGSTRLPGKPLADIGGKSMIKRIYLQAKRAKLLEKLIVATDDERIYQEVKGFGGMVRLTSSKHRCGTERVAEVAMKLRIPRDGIVVNIQGDAPLLPPRMIDQVVEALLNNPTLGMAALYSRIRDRKELTNSNIVKVVVNRDEFALYFSRSPIPYRQLQTFYKHIGPYAYRKSFLLKFIKMRPGPLEKGEKLEQLRALENGYPIKMVKTNYDCVEVDTQADLQRVRLLVKEVR